MRKLFRTVLLGLPLVILGACSSDEPIVDNPENEGPAVAEKTEMRYLKVNLVNTGGDNSYRPVQSRAIGDGANDYTNGTEAENKIRTVDFIFYDGDKNYHSRVNMSLTQAVDPTTPGNIASVHGFYETDVPVNLVAGEKMPQYVICIINAVDASFYERRTMVDAQKQMLSSFYSHEEDGNKYLSMNNSVYYGRDEVTGLDDQLIMATPFDSNKLLTESQLDKMTPDEIKDVTIDIYVERYAAKVGLNLIEGAVKDFTTATAGVTLRFEPKGWGINSYEKKFFFLKSFRQGAGDAPVFDDLPTMNGILFAGWNRPEHFRCFWSRTPGYFDNTYPVVADDILDLGSEDYPYTVFYQSFNSATNALNSSQYTMETTLKGSRLTGADMEDQYLPLTSIPSVVLVGQYKINGEAKTFYTYQKNDQDVPFVYSANSNDITGTQTIRERLLSTQTVVLQKTETGGYASVRTDNTDFFDVKHPVKNARTGLRIGGDLVTLQINGVNSDYWYYDADRQAYAQITTPNDVNKVNRLLYQNLGGAHAYINGMAFFTAPIQHWGWYREGNENKGKSIDEWDWSKMKTGDFGIVRNHVYTIDVTDISGLGTGIIDDDDPLLPPTDKVGYAVRFRVNIQKWATLPTQKWEW